MIQLDINVDATAALHGSITTVHRMLRDRDSGQILADVLDSGSFPYFGNTPCRVYDPLLLYGHENLSEAHSSSFRANDPLGFQRRPAILSVDVTIVDTSGGTWTISKSVAWELVPAPTPRAPVNTTVRQNDPARGCAFDSSHGYGLVLDLAWDPAGGPPITTYSVQVFDGAGRRLPSFPSLTNDSDTAAHRKRIVLCNAHVDAGAERGATWAVTACVGSCVVESDFGEARFDFQSCRDAGVLACQP